MDSKAYVGEVFYNIALLIQRQAETTPHVFTLSLGAIIGIACGGGVLIFGILTWVLVSCARRKNKRLKRATARQSLDDDTVIGEALRSTRPPELDLTRKSADILQPMPPFHRILAEKSSSDSMAQLLPPQPRYQANEFHNSWPFVTQEPAPLPPESHDPFILPMPEPTVPLDQHDKVYDPIQSPPAKRRPEDSELLSDIRPRTILLDKAMLKQTSPAKRPYQRSVSEGQLLQILNSVDQRLQNPKISPVRRPMPRAVSILSQISGNPPAIKLPTPDAAHIPRFSQQQLEREEYDSGSVKTLDLFSETQTPSPEKIIERDDYFKDQSRKVSMGSEDDSLYGDTPKIVIPKALSSPSKRKGRTAASESPAGVKIRQDSFRTSIEAFGGRDMSHSRENSDPFVDEDSVVHALKLPIFIQTSTSALQDTSGNRSPPKRSPILANFDFGDLVIKTSPKPLQPTINKIRGHQRSKTIRLSRIDLEPRMSRNVDILEESEIELSPVHGTASNQLSDMTEPNTRASSPTSVYSKSAYSARPPSLANFPSFLAPPTISHDSSERATRDSHTSTGGSYSATMSFYDYYSSTEINGNTIPAQQYHSPEKKEYKKFVRRGRNFSVGGHNNPGAFVFPPPICPTSPAKDSASSDTRIIPESFSVNTEKQVSPPSISRLHGPRSLPQYVPQGSVASSIASLRRMNSQISAFSDKSEGSHGSPTLPALRGGGISPNSKRGPHGSRNYLSIDLEKSSPSSMRGKAIIAEESPNERRGLSVKHAYNEKDRTIQTSDTTSPDKDFYSAEARDLPSAQADPSKMSQPELTSSPPNIRGLRFSSRDDKSSPTKGSAPPPVSAFKPRPNIFKEAAEQERIKQQGLNSQQDPRWSSATPQPPPTMFATRPQSHSKLVQPIAVGLKDVTPPKWNGPDIISPVNQLYAPSPTFEQLTFESPTRESFELAVKESPLRFPPTRVSSFEAPRQLPAMPSTTTTSLMTGTKGQRKASGKTRMEDLGWSGANRQVANNNSAIGVEHPEGIRDSLGIYDSDGFLRSSPLRGEIGRARGSGMEYMF